MTAGADETADKATGDGEDLAALGAEMRRIRLLLGVNQEQMAQRVGLAGYSQGGRRVSTPRATVSLIERGRRSPTDEVIERYLLLTDQPDALRCLVSSIRSAEQDDVADAVSAAAPATSRGRGRMSRRRRLLLWAVPGAGLTVVLVGGGMAVLDRGTAEQRRLPGQTWTETTGSPAHTWTDYKQASGRAGQPLGPRQSVQVSCRLRGYVVLDGDPWWYRLESPPWNGRFYATSDAFYNEGSTSGPVDTGVVVDEQVPVCD